MTELGITMQKVTNIVDKILDWAYTRLIVNGQS